MPLDAAAADFLRLLVEGQDESYIGGEADAIAAAIREEIGE